MKKALLIFSIFAAGAASALCADVQAKQVFVNEKQLAKVNVAPKTSKQWPDMKRVLDEKLTDAKLSVADWSIKGGELSSEAAGANLTFKNLGGQCAIFLEFLADENSEGFIFVRAPKGNIDKAVKIKIAGANKGEKREDFTGSIDSAIPPRENFDESKGARWISVKVFVEGENIRVSKTDRINGMYADRNFLTVPFEQIAKKRGSEVAADGACGIVVSGGTIKFKNIFITQF
ncbi:MAG: hypothetical protein J6P03_02435 [Opitutales bacterium]|nr:hypothetical protein [Opitutales bacterium]